MRGRRSRGSFDLGVSGAIFLIFLEASAFYVLSARGVVFPLWAKVLGVVGAIAVFILGMLFDASARWPGRDSLRKDDAKKPEPPAGGAGADRGGGSAGGPSGGTSWSENEGAAESIDRRIGRFSFQPRP